MPTATQGYLRYWRGSLLGLVVGVTTLVGHVAGHGSLALVPALMVVGLALAVAGALTGRRLRPAALLPFVVGFQVASHWVLSRAPVTPTGRPLGHAHGAGGPGEVSRRAWSAQPRPDLTVEPATAWIPHVDWSMLGGHAVASLVVIGLVWRTDAALFAFVTAFRRAIDVVLGGGFWVAPRPLTRPVRLRVTDDAPPPGHALSHPSPSQHRGPPVPAPSC